MRRAFTMSRAMPLALAMVGLAAAPALAAPPPNDARSAAASLSPPAGVSGTTAECTLEAGEDPSVSGSPVTGSVW